ncbi:hypothetical protein [Caballeronia sp. LjRoot29]|uniref:hypothetical protein n=1 Tax=Caballeronia sp. LjRoot29 TaxID=3342315 RepID=UPI003F4F8CEF
MSAVLQLFGQQVELLVFMRGNGATFGAISRARTHYAPTCNANSANTKLRERTNKTFEYDEMRVRSRV